MFPMLLFGGLKDSIEIVLVVFMNLVVVVENGYEGASGTW